MTFLLEKMTETAFYYGNLIGSAKDELKLLQKELETLRSHLLNLSHKIRKDAVQEDLEKNVRELVYEVEDAIDTCLTEAAASKNKITWDSMIGKRISLAERVKKLRQGGVKEMLERATTALRNAAPNAGAEEQGTLVTKVTKNCNHIYIYIISCHYCYYYWYLNTVNIHFS